MKIEILFTGNFDIEGRVRHCKEGEVLTVSEDDAKSLIDAKQAKEWEPVEVKRGRTNK